MNTEKIYDFIVISGIGNELKAIDIDDSESITYAMELLFVPEILMIVPQEAKPPPVLEKFLQPREGVRLHAQKQVPSFHEFVLTGLSGGQLYGFSVTEYPQFNKESYLALRELFKSQGRDKGIPDTLHSARTLAIISKYPYHKTFMNILKTFMKSLPEGWKFNKKIALDLSLLLDKVQIPKPELIPKPLIFNKINFGSFPLIPDEKHLPLSDNDFDTLFTLLSIENIIIIFSALAQERKLIFISRSLEYLTPCIFSILSLLYPFSWPYPLIPILPSDFIEVFESPMPYILGCLSSVLELCFPDGDQMIIDLDSNHIISKEPIDKLPPRIYSKLLKKLKNNCNLFKSPMKSLRISPLSGISSIGEREYEHDFEYTSFSSSSFSSSSSDDDDENNKHNDQKEKKGGNGSNNSEKISSKKNTKVVKNDNSRNFFKYRRNPLRLRKSKSNSPHINKNRKQKSLSSFSLYKVNKTELRKSQSFQKNKKHKSLGSLNQNTRITNVQQIDGKNDLKTKKNKEKEKGKKKEKRRRKKRKKRKVNKKSKKNAKTGKSEEIGNEQDNEEQQNENKKSQKEKELNNNKKIEEKIEEKGEVGEENKSDKKEKKEKNKKEEKEKKEEKGGEADKEKEDVEGKNEKIRKIKKKELNNNKKIEEKMEEQGEVGEENKSDKKEKEKNNNEEKEKNEEEGGEADKEKEEDEGKKDEQKNEKKNEKTKQNEKKELNNNKKIEEKIEKADKVEEKKKKKQEQEFENKKQEQKQKQKELEEKKEEKEKIIFNLANIRNTFLSIFIEWFKNYSRSVIIPKNEEEFMNNKIFNDEQFLETAPEDCLPLLEKFITSQMFMLYIEEQITNKSKTNSNDYFLNLIKEKLEKKYQNFIKYQNLSYSGWMKKKTNNRLKNWKNRYFILKDKQLYSSHKMITNKNNKLQQVPIFQGRSKIVIPNIKLYQKEKEKFKTNFYKMNIITRFEKNKKNVEKTLELATETQMLQKKWVKFLKFICMKNDEIQFLSKYKKMYDNETNHLRKVRKKTIIDGINLNKIFEEKEENVVTIGNLSCKIGFSTDMTEESSTDYEKNDNEKLLNK
ncbi:c-myc promoter binding protein [Anaeramoeba flamelloides]|uniref:C-myc promoter binding protein n=1 Tax=Anaeramoeba flamelloides TaxID=1746091 RepID=A0AAV8AD13_9EUKA|nr:c-myc promoter binding protein [Anaeramoeba flamelloides]